MKSWRTSLFGSGGLAVLWFNVANMLLDDNPATNPDWSTVITATFACVATLFARDNNVTSEQAGAK